MPSISPIIVNDGETVPVAHTFAPKLADKGVGTFREAGPTWLGDNTLTILPKEATANRKVRMVVGMPVVVTETVNGISSPTVIRGNYFDGSFTYAKSATEQEKKNIRTIVGNLILSDDPDVIAVLEGNGVYYG